MPTILITGANRGIGLHLARLYAADGWKVIATARDPASASDLGALPGDITVEALEVTDHAAVRTLAEKYKGQPIDVLFNNAGVIGRNSAALGRIDADELRETTLCFNGWVDVPSGSFRILAHVRNPLTEGRGTFSRDLSIVSRADAGLDPAATPTEAPGAASGGGS